MGMETSDPDATGMSITGHGVKCSCPGSGGAELCPSCQISLAQFWHCLSMTESEVRV